MSPEQVLTGLQIVATLIGFGGVAFTLGRMYGRIDTIGKTQEKMEKALFGGDDYGGVFVRRAELELMMANDSQARLAFDKRLEEFHERLGIVEGWSGKRP
jgi:hypothetical protein